VIAGILMLLFRMGLRLIAAEARWWGGAVCFKARLFVGLWRWVQ